MKGFIAVAVAALAVAAPAWAASTKNTLEVSPRVFRTHVNMVAFYDLAPDKNMVILCEGDTTSRICQDYRAQRTLLTLTFRRQGRLLYDETTGGEWGTWSQRVRFRELRDEAGPRCQPGLYFWTVILHDRWGPATNVGSRGRLRLRCERGQLVHASATT